MNYNFNYESCMRIARFGAYLGHMIPLYVSVIRARYDQLFRGGGNHFESVVLGTVSFKVSFGRFPSTSPDHRPGMGKAYAKKEPT